MLKKVDIAHPTINLEPVSGKRVHTVEILGMEKICLGTELKLRIKTLFLGKEAIFIVREITNDYLKTWKMLKNAGFPVIPLLRITKELPGFKKPSNHSMFAVIPDLTFDGSRLYGKSLSWEINKGKYRPNLKNDALFLHIMLRDFLNITKEVQKIVDLATKLDIILPEDGELAELVVHPNGSWELIMVDIVLARKRMIGLERPRDVALANKSLGQDFLEYLKNVKSKI